MFYLRLSPSLFSVKNESDLSKAESKVREHFRLSGMVLSDIEVISAMDSGFASSSVLEAVKTAKDGAIRESDLVADRDFFTRVMEHSLNRAAEFSDAILRGIIPVSPVREGSYSRPITPCGYCGYRSLCGHYDETGSRFITRKGKEDIR